MMQNLNILEGFLFTAVLFFAPMVSTSVNAVGEFRTDRPLVIAHRGSSGQLPEHTIEAYQLAVQQGADIIECDLAVTKDLQLVCSHEPMLNHTTDVEKKFPDRKRTYLIPSELKMMTDYFTIDFTFKELKTLRKIQQRGYRDQSYNYKLAMASFEENIAVAQNSSNSKTVGIYPETKMPEFFNKFLEPHNTTVEDLLLQILTKHGYTSKTSPCFVQSFDLRSLQYMANRTDLRLVFLTSTSLPDAQLDSLSAYVSGIGPSKSAIVQVDPVSNLIRRTTDFIERAHKFNFTIHPYTFRNEYQFLAYDYGADPYNEYKRFFSLGVDGLFTDFPGSAANYLSMRQTDESECPTDSTAMTTYNLTAILLTVTVGFFLANA